VAEEWFDEAPEPSLPAGPGERAPHGHAAQPARRALSPREDRDDRGQGQGRAWPGRPHGDAGQAREPSRPASGAFDDAGHRGGTPALRSDRRALRRPSWRLHAHHPRRRPARRRRSRRLPRTGRPSRDAARRQGQEGREEGKAGQGRGKGGSQGRGQAKEEGEGRRGDRVTTRAPHYGRVRSLSNPVASRPQRVTSETRSSVAARRLQNSRTMAVKKVSAADGFMASIFSRVDRWSTTRSTSVSARAVADRGRQPNRFISPKNSPGRMRARTFSMRGVTSLEITTVPWRTTNISALVSPSWNNV